MQAENSEAERDMVPAENNSSNGTGTTGKNPLVEQLLCGKCLPAKRPLYGATFTGNSSSGTSST